MTAAAFVSAEPVTLVGGAPVGAAAFRTALAHAPRLAAADSGADRALGIGALPEIVIGDMDSLSQAGHAALGPRVLEVPEQDSTDFEKCLTRIAAPLIVAVGFTGSRLDHALAVLNALVRHPQRRCVVLGEEDAVMVCPPRLALDLAAGTRVSLFPMAPMRGESEGLHWPIGAVPFAPGAAIGTSNRAEGPVRLCMGAPGMLVLLPADALGALLAGLADAPHWPGP